jgi:hypothetical protein
LRQQHSFTNLVNWFDAVCQHGHREARGQCLVVATHVDPGELDHNLVKEDQVREWAYERGCAFASTGQAVFSVLMCTTTQVPPSIRCQVVRVANCTHAFRLSVARRLCDGTGGGCASIDTPQQLPYCSERPLPEARR